MTFPPSLVSSALVSAIRAASSSKETSSRRRFVQIGCGGGNWRGVGPAGGWADCRMFVVCTVTMWVCRTGPSTTPSMSLRCPGSVTGRLRM